MGPCFHAPSTRREGSLCVFWSHRAKRSAPLCPALHASRSSLCAFGGRCFLVLAHGHTWEAGETSNVNRNLE